MRETHIRYRIGLAPGDVLYEIPACLSLIDYDRSKLPTFNYVPVALATCSLCQRKVLSWLAGGDFNPRDYWRIGEHSPADETVTCVECGQAFQNQRDVFTHLLTHVDEP